MLEVSYDTRNVKQKKNEAAGSPPVLCTLPFRPCTHSRRLPPQGITLELFGSFRIWQDEYRMRHGSVGATFL